MTQSHDASAAESSIDPLADRAQHTVLLKRRAVFHLYGQGGGVLGRIPILVGADIEKKIETPLGLAFQVKEGASTSGPLVAGISIPHPIDPHLPKYSCEQLDRRYVEDCPVLFPEKPNRLYKMFAANAINLAERMIDPAKVKADQMFIESIKRHCEALQTEVPKEKIPLIDALREKSTKRWMTRADTQAALKLCGKLGLYEPGDNKKKIAPYDPTSATLDLTARIGSLITRRSTSKHGELTTLFKRAAVASMDMVKKHWAPRESRMHDPDTRRTIFQEAMGDARLSECIGSVYFAAFDTRRMTFLPFYARKKNLFDTSMNAPATTFPHDLKVWDAAMATSANLLAYPPHRTEGGVIAADKATLHTSIFVISDIIRHKPEDADVISVTLGTGEHVTDDIDDDELFDHYAENNEIGNERILEEAKAYANTSANMAAGNLIGEKNIFVISPRMSWRNEEEFLEFPSADITDATPENMEKIENRAHKLITEEQRKINHVCQMLADNLYLLGLMDKEKFDRVTDRLGVKAALEKDNYIATHYPYVARYLRTQPS